MNVVRCQGRCGRLLVPRTEWMALSKEERGRLGRTHARNDGLSTCNGCKPKQRTAPREDAWRGRYAPGAVVIAGGWWIKKGLTLVPVGERPVERSDSRGWTE